MNSILNTKKCIISTVIYLIYAFSIIVHRQSLFSVVYFAFVGIVFLVSERILTKNNNPIQNIFIFPAIAAFFHSTAYEIFLTETTQLNKTIVAFSTAILLACLIAVMDEQNLGYCIVAAPILCFLNIKFAICYNAVLFAVSLVLLEHKKNNKTKKAKNNTLNINIVCLVVSIIGLATSITIYVKNNNIVQDSLSYYLYFGKNNLAALVAGVYLLVKLLCNKVSFTRSLLLGTIILAGVSVFSGIYIGFTSLSLLILSTFYYLAYCCLQDSKTVESIKSDYQNNQLLFWVMGILLLQ